VLQSILNATLNLLLGIILLAFLPAVFNQFIGNVADFFHHFAWHSIAFGTGMGLVIERFLNRFIPEIEILEHEITHALVGIPFGFIPTGISVSRRRGGECRHYAVIPWPLIPLYPVAKRIVTLAPYFMPIFTVIMASFRPITPSNWQPWYDLGIGATFGYHSLGTLAELRENFTSSNLADGSGRWKKSDIGKTGIIFAPIFIIVATLAVHGLILAVIVHDYSGMAQWGRETWYFTKTTTMPYIFSLVK